MLKFENAIRILENEKKRLKDLYQHLTTEEDLTKEELTEIRELIFEMDQAINLLEKPSY